jgi:hypothetical protein
LQPGKRPAMYTKLISRILFASLITGLLLGLGSGCSFFKKDKKFFIKSVPGSQNYEVT